MRKILGFSRNVRNSSVKPQLQCLGHISSSDKCEISPLIIQGKIDGKLVQKDAVYLQGKDCHYDSL